MRPEFLPTVTRAVQEILDAQGTVVQEYVASTFEFHPAHNHWHIGDIALFELHADSPTGPIVGRNAVKVTFCLIDWYRLEGNAPTKERAYWDCATSYQGISVGWVDQYHHSLDGQQLDLTGVPPGRYYLVSTANYAQTFLEQDVTNNSAWVSFDVRYDATGNAKLRLVDHSPCATPGLCGDRRAEPLNHAEPRLAAATNEARTMVGICRAVRRYAARPADRAALPRDAGAQAANHTAGHRRQRSCGAQSYIEADCHAGIAPSVPYAARSVVKLATRSVVLYHRRMPVVPIRWVGSTNSAATFAPHALRRTDLGLSAQQLMVWFVWRWHLDVPVEEARASGDRAPAPVVRRGHAAHDAGVVGLFRAGVCPSVSHGAESPGPIGGLLHPIGCDLQRSACACAPPPRPPDGHAHVWGVLWIPSSVVPRARMRTEAFRCGLCVVAFRPR